MGKTVHLTGASCTAFDICSLILTTQSIELSYSRAGNITQFSQLGSYEIKIYLSMDLTTQTLYYQDLELQHCPVTNADANSETSHSAHLFLIISECLLFDKSD